MTDKHNTAPLYQNDQWNISDDLGMGQAGDGLAKMALEVSAPFSIAVTGKWGSGKTSVMRRAFATLGGHPISQTMPLHQDEKSETDTKAWYQLSMLDKLELKKLDIEAKVEAETYDARRQRKKSLNWSEDLQATVENSFCIWFSPWQHQNNANPIIPLLLEIQAQFLLRYKLKNSASTFARQSGLAALTLLERVSNAALSLNGGAIPIAGSVQAVQEAWQAGDKDQHLTQLSDGQRFHLLFEDAIETLLAGLASTGNAESNGRIVIFIDDLDRCEGSIVVNLLEAIKLYLGTQRCVFILGLDNTAILAALNHHWSNRSEDHNREYLEKLFQATIRVPAPDDDKARQMLIQQLQVHNVPTPAIWAQHMVNLLEPNPRKLKNFANSFCAILALHNIPIAAETEADEQDAPQLLRLILFLYLNLYHPSIWRILERQPWSLRILNQVLNGTVNEQPALPEFIDKASQRMMEYFFSQAFSHVLKHDAPDNNLPSSLGEDDKHHGLDLDTAVDLFLERIDRKGSDEHFIVLSAQAFHSNDAVDEHFLSLSH